jgi:hypothetical protein
VAGARGGRCGRRPTGHLQPREDDGRRVRGQCGQRLTGCLQPGKNSGRVLDRRAKRRRRHDRLSSWVYSDLSYVWWAVGQGRAHGLGIIVLFFIARFEPIRRPSSTSTTINSGDMEEAGGPLML